MRVPKYRPRKDRDSAYVEMNGHRITLPGCVNSPESIDAYRRLLNEYLREHAGQHPPDRRPPGWAATVADLALAWLDHCRVYYAISNTRSTEYDNCRYAVRPLVAIHGDTPAGNFRADELKQVREAMITGSWKSDAARRKIKPLSRTAANAAVNRIKRMFRWGLEAGRVSPEVAAVVCCVAPLKRGRTFAREPSPIRPVENATVDATLPHLPGVVADMVRLHQLTGMRSDNLCALRPMDIDRSGPVWIYTPPAHKGSHREQSLIVALGPRCQAILTPYLDRPSDAPCFSPREVRADRRRGKRVPGGRYTTGSYACAIRRACERHGLPHWHPHQLRHAAVNAAKQARGLEGARAYVGHSAVGTTEIYEERDLELAKEIARQIG